MSRPLISTLFSLVAQTLNRLPVGLIQFLLPTIDGSASIVPHPTATFMHEAVLTNRPDNSPPVQLPNVSPPPVP